MLATATATPPTGDEWRHELKWDGVRSIVTVRDSKVRLETRSGNDCTARFPEITTSHLADFGDLVLDGEIVALVAGRPDFGAVMHRLNPRARGASGPSDAVGGARIEFMAFDVLQAAGQSIVGLPWQERRNLLEGIGLESGHIRVPPTFTDGDALLASTAAEGVEGIVSKRVDAIYRPGVRSEDWLKSVHRQNDSFIIAGWRPLEGRTQGVGAIIIGEFVGANLVYRGRVGSGFSARSSSALLEWVTPAPKPPFPTSSIPPEDLSGTHWVTPQVVCDVEFLGRSSGGRLRQPSYKGLRLDLGIAAMKRKASHG